MRVLLVDDHPLIVAALEGVLTTLGPNVAVTGCTSAAQARAQLERDDNVDLVLLDLNLGPDDGFALLAEIRALHPSVPVVVVSAQDSPPEVLRAIDAGAMGFVPKLASNDMLFEALRLVMSGGIYVPPLPLARGGLTTAQVAVSTSISHVTAPAAHAASALGSAPPAPDALAGLGLTPRQTDVLQFLLRGMSNKLIARELQLSVETVKDHVAAVLRALGVSSRTQAVLAVNALRAASEASTNQADLT